MTGTLEEACREAADRLGHAPLGRDGLFPRDRDIDAKARRIKKTRGGPTLSAIRDLIWKELVRRLLRKPEFEP
jgi:hypothetical protein